MKYLDSSVQVSLIAQVPHFPSAQKPKCLRALSAWMLKYFKYSSAPVFCECPNS